MELRALEPDDLPALRALCLEPEVNRHLDIPADAPLESFAGWLGTAPGTHVAFGSFEGGGLLGACGMTAVDRPRMRHLARAWIAVRPEGVEVARRLLTALRDLGRDWWSLQRIELTQPAAWPHLELLEGLGFAREASRRLDFMQDGRATDSVLHAWTRDGVHATARATTVPRGDRGRPGGELVIREVTPADAVEFARVLADPTVIWGTLQSPFTPSATWQRRLSTNDPARNRILGAWAGGELVGNAGLHGLPGAKRQHVWAMGMSIRAPWQGLGVGRRLMERLLALADGMAVPRVELDVYVDNSRAIALYERSGFVREGTKRLEAFRDGAYVDAFVMARLREGR